MNEAKRKLMGSESRDRFKYLHKNKVYDQFYALDIDFALVEKNEGAAENGDALPLIVAILDFKLPGDNPTFTEVLAYNQFKQANIPVYIVEANDERFCEKSPSEHRFTVYEYNGGDWRPNPPRWDGKVVLEDAKWEDFESWQDNLRIERRNIEKVRHKVKKRLQETKEEIDELEEYQTAEKVMEVVLSDDELLRMLTDNIDDL